MLLGIIFFKIEADLDVKKCKYQMKISRKINFNKQIGNLKIYFNLFDI